MASKQNQCADCGYVLYLVVVLLIVAAAVITILARHTSRVRIAVLHAQQLQQARFLAQSGITRTEHFLNGGDGHDMRWETDSFSEVIPEYGSILISCKPFGLFSRVVSNGTRMRKTATFSGILGRNAPDTLSPIITISGSTRGLVIDDQTVLGGKVVLDYGPVVRGEGKRPIAGSEKWVINRPSASLPFDPGLMDTLIMNCATELDSVSKNPQAISGSIVLTQDSDTLLNRQPLAVLGDCHLRNIALEGKTIIAKKRIIIDENACCKGCSFIAESLECRSGATDNCLFYTRGKSFLLSGKHNSQFIASDTIRIGKEVSTGISTAWVSKRTAKNDTLQHGAILFCDNGKWTGFALCYSDSVQRRQLKIRGSGVVLGNNCSFTGYLICDGDVEIPKANIEGHLWAQSLTGIKEGRKALHWLYGVSIKPLNRPVLFPLCGEKPVSVQLAQ